MSQKKCIFMYDLVIVMFVRRSSEFCYNSILWWRESCKPLKNLIFAMRMVGLNKNRLIKLFINYSEKDTKRRLNEAENFRLLPQNHYLNKLKIHLIISQTQILCL